LPSGIKEESRIFTGIFVSLPGMTYSLKVKMPYLVQLAKNGKRRVEAAASFLRQMPEIHASGTFTRRSKTVLFILTDTPCFFIISPES